MGSHRTETPREKLEAWLQYFDDLNLGEFFKDRRTMAKRSVPTAECSSVNRR